MISILKWYNSSTEPLLYKMVQLRLLLAKSFNTLNYFEQLLLSLTNMLTNKNYIIVTTIIVLHLLSESLELL